MNNVPFKVICDHAESYEEIKDWLTAFDETEIINVKCDENNLIITFLGSDFVADAIKETLPRKKNIKYHFEDRYNASLSNQLPKDSALSESKLEKIICAFQNDPRNKVFAPFDYLAEIVLEEAGELVDQMKLIQVVRMYEGGILEDETCQKIYDASVYACNLVGRKCFDLEDEADCTISWLVDEDGVISAEIRP